MLPQTSGRRIVLYTRPFISDGKLERLRLTLIRRRCACRTASEPKTRVLRRFGNLIRVRQLINPTRPGPGRQALWRARGEACWSSRVSDRRGSHAADPEPAGTDVEPGRTRRHRPGQTSRLAGAVHPTTVWTSSDIRRFVPVSQPASRPVDVHVLSAINSSSRPLYQTINIAVVYDHQKPSSVIGRNRVTWHVL